MRKLSFLLFTAAILFTVGCDDKKGTGEAAVQSFVDTAAPTVVVSDSASAMTASKMPFDIVPNATAQKWYKDYMDLITASTPPNPPSGTPPPAFDVTKIITQIHVSNELNKQLRKLSPKHIKYCIALKTGSKATVLIQVKLQNDTYLYYDMSDPVGVRTYSEVDPFCPPPPGCTLEGPIVE